MNNMEKYLPIGTVVILKNGKKRIMITGYIVQGKETGDKVYDYIGCLYPEGVISSDRNLLFDHDQINQIFYVGYSDDEQKSFMVKLHQLVSNELGQNGNPTQQESQNNVEQTNTENVEQSNNQDMEPVISFDDVAVSNEINESQNSMQSTNNNVDNDIFNSVPSSTNN